MDSRKFKKFRISLSSHQAIEPEEIFFDGSKLREFEESETITGKLERPLASASLSLARGVQMGMLALFLLYTGFLIIQKGDDYTAQAQDNSFRAFPIFSERGRIYSSDGVTLAQNELFFDLFVRAPKITTKNPKEDFLELSKNISRVLGVRQEDVYEKFNEAYIRRFSELALVRGLSREQVVELDEYIADVPFIEIREAARRKFSGNISFSHIVGYTGEISQLDIDAGGYIRGERIGKSGVESYYDSELRGKTGIFIKKIDSSGRVLGSEIKRNPEAGKDIVLNIRADLQESVNAILKKHMQALGVASAVAIVLNPRNGAVLSSVSLPTFNANVFERGIDEQKLSDLNANPHKPFVNRVIAGEYPSGSTIKPIIAAAALEEKIVTPSSLVFSGGSIYVPSVYNPKVQYEFKDWKAHGWTDMRKAIADSVNIYFYTIGGGYKDKKGLGIQKIEEYLKKFGWGELLGIDIPGERSGLIPNPKWKKERKGENWYIGDTYNTSIGQGDVLVTPLQVAAATAVFANGGTLFVPHIASKIGDKSVPPEAIRKRFITQENIRVVREGMRRAVESGSSKFLAGLSQNVAGKTGTAQTGRPRNHAWFTGFGPYKNPSVVVTVLLEEGGKSDYAVRVAKEIFEAYFAL